MNQDLQLSEIDLHGAVRRLLAESEIRKVLYDYCRGVDRLDRELMRSIYHEDALDSHSTGFSGSGREFAEYVMETFPARGYSTTSHNVTQSRIDVATSGTTASVESYYVVAHSDEQTIFWMLGRYLDKFECRDGVWKIAHRQVVADLNYRTEIIEAYPPSRVVAGRQDRADVSYDFLGWE